MLSNQHSKFLLGLIVMLLLFFAGCASIDKAEQLHRDGKDGEALDMAADFINSEDKNERLRTIRLLGDIGGDRAGKMVTTRLTDQDREVQIEAIKTVGDLQYEGAANGLVRLVPKVRGEAFEEVATAFEKIGSAAIDPLTKKYHSSSGSNREAYKKMLIKIGPAVTSSIIGALKGRSYFDNRDNFDILISLKNPKVASLLLPSLADEEVAHMVIESLVKLGSLAIDATIASLRKNVDSKGDAVVRERLVKILGELRSPKATPILEELSQDDDERVRIAVTNSLRKIRNF